MAILQPRPPERFADLPKVLGLAKRRNALIKVCGACAKAYGWSPDKERK